MEKMNILLSLLLVFTGISAVDIQAAAKQDPRDEDVRPMQQEEDKSEAQITGNRRRREEVNEEQRNLKQKVEEEKKSEEKKEELSFERKAEIEKVNKLLFDGIRFNDIKKIELAFKKGADINGQNSHGSTFLFVAAIQGRTEIVKLLLDKNADVNIHNNDGDTPLIAAAHHGRTEIVKLLLENNAIVNDQALKLIKGNPASNNIYQEYRATRKLS